MFSSETYTARRSKLRKLIKSGIVLLPGNIDSAMNYPKNTYRFRQDSSFLYYFGLSKPGIVGVMDIDEGRDTLFANDSDIEDIIWMGDSPGIAEMGQAVGVTHTQSLRELPATLCRAAKQGRKIHFLPQYRAHSLLMLERVLGIQPEFISNYSSISLVKAIVAQRSIKEPCEVESIDRACDIGYQMHTIAMSMARVGVLEQEIVGAIEGIAIGQGYMPSFPIILSQNGHILHNHDHSQRLAQGRLLVTDAGAECTNHYASDFTRTIPVGGRFTQQQSEIYTIVLNALNGAIELSKPGVTYQSVHLEAARIITDGLKGLGLMTGDTHEAVRNGAHALFFPHGLGHMLGLDVHDMEGLGEDNVGYDDEVARIDQFGTAYLRLGRRLQPGFTLTVEPGIYFIPALISKWEQEGINASFINYPTVRKYLGFGGIRLEDDILITEGGSRLLGSKRIPLTLQEVEAACG